MQSFYFEKEFSLEKEEEEEIEINVMKDRIKEFNNKTEEIE